MSSPIITVFGLGAPTKLSPSRLGQGVGGHAVRVASELGMTVRAVARNPAKYESHFNGLRGVTLVKGDVTQPESVAECLKDATAAIFAAQAPTSALFAAQAADDVTAWAIERDALILVGKECLKANCKLVVISSCFVSPKHYLNPIRVFLNTVVKWRTMDAKWEGEEAIRAMEGLNYTIIRPSGLTDKGPQPNKYTIAQGDGFSSARYTIPRVDVGKVAIAACVDPATDRTTFEVSGSASPEPATVQGIFAGLQKDK